jgi:PBP1b-binding outer membrane lipoprotein LpoB
MADFFRPAQIQVMKKAFAYTLLLAGMFSLAGCISVKSQRAPSTRATVTTTEETTARNPHSTTVETQTTRTY